MKTRPILVAAISALLVATGAAYAKPGKKPAKASGKRAPSPAPVYSPSAAYSLGGFYPRSPCAPGVCPDSIALGRAIRRELQRQELRRELEARAAAAARPGEPSPYTAPRYLPPPTPEAQMQPRYRGTGEIRPEYQMSGQPR